MNRETGKMDKSRKTRILRMGFAALALGLVVSPVSVLAQDSEQVPFGSLKLSDSKDPIKIDADKLEMRDKDGMAIFTGNVSVVQGDALLKSGKMIVFYNKDAQGEGGQASGAAGLSSAGIDHLEISGKVYLKSGTQVATGDSGTYDGKSQIMVLEGQKVVLTDGDNVATGCKLTANMSTGKAFLESCKGQSKGRVSIIMAPNDQQQGGGAPNSN
ncbi:LPS ABC transporter substrate-binding protein LptA [Falsochrobactrum shanghaiense]|uniref:LPS ABC transporter substrate-binding protein LptA n=1 Tax=Falsochrobactrum shanghaiense TaxID=2201899 RepID=A0A316JDJ0_9HYPH|nr:LptA/OstA family protein [Falsochrobactrum shanghaiense]PWL19328.1 LPS ABC transporter substrate-binding protein LptA [Falsochrobactrum shanghaiense]